MCWLRLIRSPRVGATTFHRLLTEHGSAAAALDALPAIARAAGVSDYAPCPRDRAAAEIDLARAKGARMLCLGTEAYPANLAQLADAPPVLWCMGQRAPILRPMVALVGARNASSLGTRTARALAEGLGHEGYTVVSGLARGVDAAAHHGSLRSGTIAVMAGGVDVVYPVENAVLAAAIADQGLRLSEQPMGLHPQGRHFPPRNRIVSGLALAVVVVEAAEKSGSLITARDALDQGREIMAVPGHPVDGRAGGCNRLIREGATLVRHVEDVLEVLARLQDPPVARNDNREARLPDDRAPRPHAAPDDSGSDPRHTKTARAPDGRKAPPGPRRCSEAGQATGAGSTQTRKTNSAPPVTAGQASSPRPACPSQSGSYPTAPEVARPKLDASADVSVPCTGNTPGPRNGTPRALDAPSAAPGRVASPDAKGRNPAPDVPMSGETAEDLQRRILDCLSASPVAEDQVIRDLGVPAATVSRSLVLLEISGTVRRHPGGLVSRG